MYHSVGIINAATSAATALQPGAPAPSASSVVQPVVTTSQTVAQNQPMSPEQQAAYNAAMQQAGRTAAAAGRSVGPHAAVPYSSMTPAQQAAYNAAMQQAGRTAAASASTPHTAADRARVYGELKPIAYPPPPPPIVLEAQTAAASAKRESDAAAIAPSVQAAAAAADRAATEAMIAVRKAGAAPANAEARAAASSAQAALQAAAAAVAKWTKEPVAAVSSRLQQSGQAQAAAEAKLSSNAMFSMLNSAAQMWGKARLDWRFWTGVGAAIYGTWLRTRR